MGESRTHRRIDDIKQAYIEEVVYLYCGEEYVVDGDMVVPLEKEIDRTIDVRE